MNNDEALIGRLRTSAQRLRFTSDAAPPPTGDELGTFVLNRQGDLMRVALVAAPDGGRFLSVWKWRYGPDGEKFPIPQSGLRLDVRHLPAFAELVAAAVERVAAEDGRGAA